MLDAAPSACGGDECSQQIADTRVANLHLVVGYLRLISPVAPDGVDQQLMKSVSVLRVGLRGQFFHNGAPPPHLKIE